MEHSVDKLLKYVPFYMKHEYNNVTNVSCEAYVKMNTVVK